MKLFYDKLVALTLIDYPERQEYIEYVLKENNLKYELLLSKKHDKPLIGCLNAHINAIKYAKSLNLDTIMICEDDIIIKDTFKDCDIPLEWDMIFFGGILSNIRFQIPGWILGTFWCAHAYVIKSTLFDFILDIYNTLDLNDMHYNGKTIDWLYTTYVMPKFNCWLKEDQ